jgi:uncharacterized membrane protein
VRVLGFSDGLFAIAMTLLVVSVGIPVLHDENSVHELLDDLNHRSAEIVSFFISFVVIGRYWVAHHRFFALIGAFDYGLIAVNLVYLAFIAFLPFPTALLGNYFDNPLSVIVYAINIALVSGLEVLLMQRAHRSGLFERPMPPAVYRWGMVASSLPVAFMLLSVPLAFVGSWLAVLCWFASAPVQGLFLNRRMPAEAADWF